MKKNILALMIIGLVMLLLLTTGLLVVRKDLKSFIQHTEVDRYKVVQLDTFQSVRILSGWNVRIRQGKQFRCLINVEDTVLQPRIKTSNGVLELSIDTTLLKVGGRQIFAKVTLPSLLSIKAEGNTDIDIEDFKSDSLNVSLTDGCRFTGQNNKFQHIIFNSTGGARVELRDHYSDL